MNAAVRLAKDAGTALAYANADDFAADVDWLTTIPEYFQNVLFDPQTSGGLLFTCEQSAADHILRQITAVGFGAAAIIGRVHETGAPVVIVE